MTKYYTDGASAVEATQCFKHGDHPAIFRSRHNQDVMVIITLNGLITLEPGDWIVSGTLGNFLPVKNEEFSKRYTPIAA